MTFESCLCEHIKGHPKLRPQDIVKYCYQAAFGAEHLLSDIDRAKTYFEEEYLTTEERNQALYEELNETYCRLNLAAWKAANRNPEDAFKLFTRTAGAVSGVKKSIEEYLNNVPNVLAAVGMGFLSDEWLSFKEEYLRDGIRPIHHSEEYRREYLPAYRVVRNDLVREYEARAGER